MSRTPCSGCGAELANGWYLCHEDTLDLEFQLRRVFPVYGNVLATLQRRDVGTKALGSNGGKASSVEPVNLSVLDHVMTLQSVLTGWAAQIPTARPTSREPHHIAAWMLQPAIVSLIRRQTWAYDLALELADALHPLALAADHSQERVDIGPCPHGCGGNLKAIAGAKWATCTECQERFDTAEQKQWMISEAWHVTAPLPQIVRALHALQVYVTQKNADNWASRRKLIACIADDGTKTYQLKQVYAVHTAMVAKQEATKARAAARKLKQAA